MFLDRHLDTEVACGQHIGASKREHQEHMSGPYTDALDLGQMLDYLVVRQIGKLQEIQLTVLCLGGLIAAISGFDARSGRG